MITQRTVVEGRPFLWDGEDDNVVVVVKANILLGERRGMEG